MSPPAHTPAPLAAAVLFDLDGLLADTEPAWTVAETELAARLGRPWPPELKPLIAGTRLDRAVPLILRYLGVDAGPPAVADASRFLLARMVELFAGSVPLFPGGRELLDAIRARGVRTGLVSSSYRTLVDAALGALGAARFDVSIAGDEVTCGKPDPAPYLAAAALLGVSPDRCVVVEDAIAGVESAEAAGMTVVAVPDVAPIPATARRPVVAALASIDVEWLLALPVPTLTAPS